MNDDIIKIESKTCTTCLSEKHVSEFYKDKRSKDLYHVICKKCKDLMHKHTRENNKECFDIDRLPKHKKCPNCKIIKYRDEYCIDRGIKDGLGYYCKKCYKDKNKECVEKMIKQFDETTISEMKICTYCGIEKNSSNFSIDKSRKNGLRSRCKQCVYQISYKYQLEYLRSDPIFKLRKQISTTIGKVLKKNGSGKTSPTWQKLPYSPQDLKEHLESQFELWMNWENHGRYSKDRKTWQIDHIIPQSSFKFVSMDDENFQKCWALENLRPLESSENLRKWSKQ